MNTFKKALLRGTVPFIIMLCTVFLCLLLSGWFPVGEVQDVLKIFGIFIVTSVVLWSLAYFVIVKFFKTS